MNKHSFQNISKYLIPFVTFFLGLILGRLSSLTTYIQGAHADAWSILPSDFSMVKSANSTVTLTMVRQEYVDDQNNDQVHVLYTLSGDDPDFIAEFSISLKSSLLNSPLDNDMTIHVVADEKAYRAIGPIFNTSKIDQWKTRNQIWIKSYNIESKIPNWKQVISASTNSTLDKRHTIGTYFRLMASDILPATVEHALYIDTDVAMMVNLEELWRHRNSSSLFQWGETQCAGFVLLNVPLMEKCLWKLVHESYSKINETKKIDDQKILRLLTNNYPHMVSFLPPEWDTHRADNFWRWKGGEGILINRPKAGMVHFNGEMEGDEANAFLGSMRPIWMAVKYYAYHPWEWTKFYLESQIKFGHGHQIILDYTPPLRL